MMKHHYFPPQFDHTAYHCPRCSVFAAQSWRDVVINLPRALEPTDLRASFCSHCKNWSYWHEGRLIIPTEGPVEPAHSDLPPNCLDEYNEARDIVARSPRGAVALLRLCLQKLMPHLKEEGKNINDDIKSLVAKGLPPVVQQALDVCRVVGNNAVHPGEININDTPDIAHQLFKLINFIVEDRISKPKQIQDLYSALPKGAIEAIAKRDGNQQEK